jgi:quinol monooxygenase YgiN
MWAQLITVQTKDGAEDGVAKIFEQLQAIEQPDSGLVRATAMRDDKDPSRLLLLVVFDSEEAARAREADPRRQEGLPEVHATMAEVFAGAPEFTDLTVVAEFGG